MVEDGDLYSVEWTPAFAEDVVAAVSYISDNLGSPIAARNLYAGIERLLDLQRAMPTSATTHTSVDGTTYRIVTYKNWNIYYVIDSDAIVPLALKHRLQREGREMLQRDPQ